jgi:hypothetical protein
MNLAVGQNMFIFREKKSLSNFFFLSVHFLNLRDCVAEQQNRTQHNIKQLFFTDVHMDKNATALAQTQLHMKMGKAKFIQLHLQQLQLIHTNIYNNYN